MKPLRPASRDKLAVRNQISDTESTEIQDELSVIWLPESTTLKNVELLVIAYSHPIQLDTDVFKPFFTQDFIQSYVMIQHQSSNGAFQTFALLEFGRVYWLDAELFKVNGVIPRLGEPVQWSKTANVMLKTGGAHHNLSQLYMKWLKDEVSDIHKLKVQLQNAEEMRWRVKMFMKNKLNSRSVKNICSFVRERDNWCHNGDSLPMPDVSNQHPTVQDWFKAYWNPRDRKKALWIYGDPKFGSSIWINPDNKTDSLIDPRHVVYCERIITMRDFNPQKTRLVVVDNGELHQKSKKTPRNILLLFETQPFIYFVGRGSEKSISGNFCTIVLSDREAFMRFQNKYSKDPETMSYIIPFHLEYKMCEGYHPQDYINSQTSPLEPEIDPSREQILHDIAQMIRRITPEECRQVMSRLAQKFPESINRIENNRDPETQFERDPAQRRKKLACPPPYSKSSPFRRSQENPR